LPVLLVSQDNPDAPAPGSADNVVSDYKKLAAEIVRHGQ
jgi:hypothetical protein